MVCLGIFKAKIKNFYNNKQAGFGIFEKKVLSSRGRTALIFKLTHIMEETRGRIVIGEADRTHLTMAAKWAKFIAIVQFVLYGIALLFMLVGLLGVVAAGASFSEMGGAFNGMPTGFMIGYFVFLIAAMAVSIFLAIYLYRFATKTLRAVHEGNDAVMTEAFADLGKYFRLTGIMFIAWIAVMVLIIILMVAFAGSIAAAGF
jgi:uncharacterized membrane protein